MHIFLNRLKKAYDRNKFQIKAIKGFTLLELLVVFSFIGILTSLGIASYSSYNSKQTVTSNAANVETQLSAAKSKAISQVVPSNCGSNPLTGYEVDITVNGRQYTLSAVCGSKNVISTNMLAPQLSFANGSTGSVFFNVATGSVSNPANFLIAGYGQATTVAVNNAGIIVLEAGTHAINTPTATPVLSQNPQPTNPFPSGNLGNCIPSVILVNPCRPWFGAAAKGNPQAASDALSQFAYLESQIGHPMDIFHDYHVPGNLPLNSDEIHFAKRANTYIYVNWKPASIWADAGGGKATINAQIDQVAANIKAIEPTKIFLTVWHEPENDVSTFDNNSEKSACQKDPNFKGLKGTAGSPAQYQAMWLNVRNRFTSDGVTNVVWVMNYMNYPPWQCLVSYMWPGNSLVDWVTFEAYPYGTTTFQTKISDMYNLLQADNDAAHNFESKPWGIAEFEDCNDTIQSLVYQHYQQLKVLIDANTFPRLKMYMAYADNGNNAGDGCLANYSVASVYDPTEQKYFNLVANDSIFTASQ